MGGGEDLYQKKGPSGILAGFLSALVLLALLAVTFARYRHSIWTEANLITATFYGEAALSRSLHLRTLAGRALCLVLDDIIRAVFDLALAGHIASLRMMCTGVLVGFGWYYLMFSNLRRDVNPLIPLYTLWTRIMAGHAPYGGSLGRSRATFLRRRRVR